MLEAHYKPANIYGTHHRLIQIAALSNSDGIIGVDGEIPFHLPGDLPRFKRLTMGRPMIMGRKTFESLPGILPGRHHIVLTRQPETLYDGRMITVGDPENPATIQLKKNQTVSFVNTVEQALRLPEVMKHPDVFIIGGGQVYEETFEACHELRLTYALGEVEVPEDAEEVTHYPLHKVDAEEGDWVMTCLSMPQVEEGETVTHIYCDFSRILDPDNSQKVRLRELWKDLNIEF